MSGRRPRGDGGGGRTGGGGGGGRPPPPAPGMEITVEDAVLMLLYADPRPVAGKGCLLRQVSLAVAQALAGCGVVPVDMGGRGSARPSLAHMEGAVEQLLFSNNIRVSGGGGSRGLLVEITDRGRDRIKGRYAHLPEDACRALASIRGEEDATTPAGRSRACGTGTSEAVSEGDTRGADRKSAHGSRGAGQDLGKMRKARGPSKPPAPNDPLEAANKAPSEPSAGAGAAPAAASSSADGRQAVFTAPVCPPAAAETGPMPSGSRGAGRRIPKITGIPSLAGIPVGPAGIGGSTGIQIPPEPVVLDPRPGAAVASEDVVVQTLFELYGEGQLSQRDGAMAQNFIHDILSNYVYPGLLGAFEDRPVPGGFSVYAVRIRMYSDERRNAALLNEDADLRATCRLRRGAEPGECIHDGDIEDVVSITEGKPDPDAATALLLRVHGRWLGRIDLLYNKAVVRKKVGLALGFLEDSRKGDIGTGSRYNLLWSASELLAESMLLIFNMLRPKSDHATIRKTLEAILRAHNLDYIDEYREISQIRESLRYGPPHPDRLGEARKKAKRLHDATMRFAEFALDYLEKRQVGLDGGNPRVAPFCDPAGRAGG